MPSIPLHFATPAAPSVILAGSTVAAQATIAATHNQGAAVMISNPGTGTAYFCIGGTVDINTGFPVFPLDTAGPVYLEEVAAPVVVSAIMSSGTAALRVSVVRPIGGQ